jgi:chorismate mutase
MITELVRRRKIEGKPLLIAGPCSAETEDQVLQTAQQLQNVGVDWFRAGIWKPRTRPGSFEGVGSVGLPWLKRVKEELGMKTTVEVATTQHVEDALKYNIDMLWIGARTTANPFAVQEVANALRGVDIPIMVKNPVNPDVSLWLGAIERIEKSNVGDIGAIHRGVSQFEKSMYRNKPEWQMAIELKKQRPALSLICDPSHIAGNRELIEQVAQMALDLKMDGLMIETHINPDYAWSDAAQQVTPAQLSQIIHRLICKEEQPEGVALHTIDELRNSINYVDQQLIDLLSYRMQIVEEIAQFKKQHNMTIFQEERWNALSEKHKTTAAKIGLDPEFVYQIFKEIHLASIDRQTAIINTNKNENNSL